MLRGAGEADGKKLKNTLAKRFLREAKSAARISHPNVVTIHAVGQQEDRPYLVMEYVEGGSLAEHLRRAGPMHWREATAVIRDALLGLIAAHAKGVIHRDIKPANLMRGRAANGDPLIKLADFGLARIVAWPLAGTDSSEGDLTFPGAFVGSPSYSSPEQISGVLELDGLADLYSLTATWYALLTGQPPFVEDDPADVMQHHVHDPFPDPRGLSPTVAAAVVMIMTKASRKKPAEQHANAAAASLAAVEKAIGSDGNRDGGIADSPRALETRRGESTAAPPNRLVRRAANAHETLHLLESRLATATGTGRTTAPRRSPRCACLHTLYARWSRPAGGDAGGVSGERLGACIS